MDNLLGRTPLRCTHSGKFCDGEIHCDTCHICILQGFVYGEYHYCEEHKPVTWDIEIAQMNKEEFDSQDEMYWTEWYIEDVTCDCSSDCECHINNGS
jgi:hypothetical protein